MNRCTCRIDLNLRIPRSRTLVASCDCSARLFSQELALSGISAWTDLAGKAFPVPAFESLPFATAVPEAREVVDASFAFIEELLAVQKDFSVKLLDAVAPKKTK
jgi:hypothetical protein